jgi:hypothetical protein
MLIYYSKKRIAKWSFWHEKGKWPFSLTVGISIGLTLCALFLGIFMLTGFYLSFFRMVGATLAFALGGTVIGWMAWYDNEEKFGLWEIQQKKRPQPSN